ncbi:MAG: helix-turn-helix domain-containing protein [Paracoccaceae bacterium]
MILDAAFGVFAQYGYRRTVMEDIARAAGMSRTALYLHWRNKDDLFRALASRYFADAKRDVVAALAGAADVEAGLMAAFVAKDGKFMEAVLSTPHGPELLEAGFSVTADIAAEGEACLTDLLADWLDGQGVPADLGGAHAVATSIMVALKGLKMTTQTMAGYTEGQARLARLFARALR